MITYSSAVTINRPPADVFPYIVEREKQALWTDVAMRPLTEGPVRVGSRMELTFGRGPLRATLVLEYIAIETDRRVAWTTSSAGSIKWDGEYRLEPASPAGTRLSQSGRLRFNGLWRLLEPIVGAEIRKGEVKELEKLKTILETGSEARTVMQ